MTRQTIDARAPNRSARIYLDREGSVRQAPLSLIEPRMARRRPALPVGGRAARKEMFQEHEVARWVREAASGTGAAAGRDVMMFAQRHGMGDAAARDVGVAVCQAVPYAADIGAALRSCVVVEAATDGKWLSVRIDGDADRSGSDADAVVDLLVCELADRFEYGTRWPGTGTSVLMEFAITRAEAPGATAAAEQEHCSVRAPVAMSCGRGGAARVRLSSTRRRGRRRAIRRPPPAHEGAARATPPTLVTSRSADSGSPYGERTSSRCGSRRADAPECSRSSKALVAEDPLGTSGSTSGR